MAVDYDLVVMGDSAAGCWAAIAAARFSARVALITTPGYTPHTQDLTMALRELGAKTRQANCLASLQHPVQVSARDRTLDFAQVSQWADTMVTTLTQHHQAALMSELGIDRIIGPGEFQRQPTLQVQVDGRQVRSRAYLIAVDADLAAPPIPGLTPFRVKDLITQVRTQERPWPQDVVVIGAGPTATTLSQSFARLGTQVTLVVRHNRVLPDEDPDAAYLVQAQLEADGVCVLTHNTVESVTSKSGQRQQVLTTTTPLDTQAVVWAADSGDRATPWDLAQLGLKSTPQGLWVNPKLQTTHPHIYACGSILGGYPLAHVARYEASIALKNVLFGPFHSVDYRWIPWAVWTDPELARVGLTEAQARQQYQDVHVLKQVDWTLARAQLQGETAGCCKLIVRNKGQILGAHLVGAAAAEIVHLIAFAMKHRCRVQDLAEFVHISPTLAEIVNQTAMAEQTPQHQGRRHRWEWLFNSLRRSLAG